MKSNKLTPKKNNAQAMVEFAIVLPILLLLLYGLLEAGRLLFMYSTIVTASRQASRYGASTGAGIGGAERYRDCAGIRLAANNVDYLNAFDHTGADVQITYDEGVDNDGTPIPVSAPWTNNSCDGASDPNVTPSANNTTRVLVTVTGHFNPIVPLVPFGQRNITATSARTILMGVTINVPNPAAEITTTLLGLVPHRPDDPGTPGIEPHSELGEIVTATASVTAASGTPTGSIEFRVTESATGITVSVCTRAYSGSPVTCDITFNNLGSYLVQAIYTPGSSAFLSSSEDETQVVGQATTTVELTGPGWSLAGNNVTYHITVTSLFGVPSGTVDVTSAGGTCAVTLVSGEGDCVMNFATVGDNFPIDAVYSGDAEHLGSTDTVYHDVLSAPATLTFTAPPPPPTNTVPPPTVTLTPTPEATPVLGCTNIVPQGTIVLSAKTMYLDIRNPMDYDVTVADVFLRWNYLQGANGHDITLVSAQLNSTLGTNVFWTGEVDAPSFSPPLSTVVIIPRNSTSRIVFTFDKMYTRSEGEQIQIRFSTPGCQDHTINVVKPD